MNIFEKRSTLDKELNDICLEIWGILNTKATEMNVELPWFSRGITFGCNQYTDSNWIDNPHYNPKLPHTPENLALQTGFSKIEVKSEVVQIHVEELPDEYEDWECDSYYIKFPLDVFLSGNFEQHIVEHLQKDVDRNECFKRRKYLELFDFDKRTIQEIFAYCMLNNLDFNSIKDYRERTKILVECGVMKDGD